jgi:hypothetical protein
MPAIESGDRPIAVGAGGAAAARLNVLAARDAAAAPPYAFDEFRQRGARRHAARVTVGWSVAASVASLGLVLMLALVTGRQAPMAEGAAAHAQRDALPDEQSALVDLGQFAVTSELEDNIAWLDAALSESRVQSAPAEQLRQLESARNQLAESLQKVSYAHSYLSL